jgi:hypothetical protein
MREDREDRSARGALDPPDGHPTQTDAHIMRMARQAPTSLTRRLVCELKAQGQDNSHHQFHKGLAVAKQLYVGRFVLKIDGDGPVFTADFRGAKSTHIPHRRPHRFSTPIFAD